MVIIGVASRGNKEFLAIEDGCRESEQSWAEEFGESYIVRNDGQELLASNIKFRLGVKTSIVYFILP
jgi:hypothetical protein